MGRYAESMVCFRLTGSTLALSFALACDPSVDDAAGDTDDAPPGDALPESCDEPPYDADCEEAFALRCEAQPDASSCGAVDALPGGVSLQCAWVEPERIVDPLTCERQPAEPRCVGVAYPGDIGCSPFLEVDGDVLVAVPEACFPIGWGECTDADAPQACACVDR